MVCPCRQLLLKILVHVEKERICSTLSVIRTILHRHRSPHKNQGRPVVTSETLLNLIKNNQIQWDARDSDNKSLFVALATDPTLCTPEILEHFSKNLSLFSIHDSDAKYRDRCRVVMFTAVGYKNMAVLRLFTDEINPFRKVRGMSVSMFISFHYLLILFYYWRLGTTSPFRQALRVGFVEAIRFFLNTARRSYLASVDFNHVMVVDAIHGCHRMRSAEPLQALLCSTFPIDADFKALRDKERTGNPYPEAYQDIMLEYLHQAEQWRTQYRNRAVVQVPQWCPLLTDLCSIVLEYAALQDLDPGSFSPFTV